jgi:cell wall assembly regulator SMI1
MSDRARDEAPFLGSALLDALDERWRRYCPALLARLSPGLTGQEIEGATRPLGVRLPLEARLWWQWHDGVPAERVRFANERVCAGPGFAYLPLREAIERYDMMRELAERLASDAVPEGWSADTWWDPNWFPITVAGNGRVVACDCSVPDGQITPIRSIKWGVDDDWQIVRARSFGEMVTWWLEGFDAGAYRYDTTEHDWDYRGDLLDTERELSRIV